MADDKQFAPDPGVYAEMAQAMQPMTKPPEPVVTGELKVTQDDRVEAARVYQHFRDPDYAGWILAGTNAGGDYNPIIQAFARHRTANALPGDVGMLKLEWRDGPPPKPWSEEWFIAETIYGDRVALRSLPEERSYDFKTADDTYMKAENVKRWMQFPDSEYIAPTTPSMAAPRLNDALATKLRAALRFSASHSVMSSEDEQGILAALTPSALSGNAGICDDADVHACCTEALLRHRGCEVPKDRDWSAVQFGEIAASDVRAILAALTPSALSGCPHEAWEDRGGAKCCVDCGIWFEDAATPSALSATVSQS